MHLPTRHLPFFWFLLVVAMAWASPGSGQEVPTKAPLTRYASLWTDSPFTAKPQSPQQGPAANPLENYTLAGIAPVPGGHRITLINKQAPDQRTVIEPGRVSEFTVMAINRDPQRLLGTSVVLKSGYIEGTVSFEKEHLTISPPPQPQAPAAELGLPPGIDPAATTIQVQDGQESVRQPRPRIVPPPAAGNNDSGTEPMRERRQ